MSPPQRSWLPRRFWVICVGGFVFFSTYLLSQSDVSLRSSVYQHDTQLESHKPTTSGSEEVASDDLLKHHKLPSTSTSTTPLITLIVVWTPNPAKKPPAYLPNFFESFAYQHRVKLLLIVLDKQDTGCKNRISPELSNIEERCFSKEDYWRLHADFLCTKWGCDKEEWDKLHQTLIIRGEWDFVSALIRVFRQQ